MFLKLKFYNKILVFLVMVGKLMVYQNLMKKSEKFAIKLKKKC